MTSQTLQVITLFVGIISVFFSGVTIFILATIVKQHREAADEVEKVKETLEKSTNKLAKEETLQKIVDDKIDLK